MSRFTSPKPYSPLSDDAWLALLPYILPRAPQGRRVADLRRRMDGIFWLASTPGAPWKDLPPEFGRPDTVARFFRRLTHSGLWHRLLQELARTGPKHPLRSIEYAICRATRRAARLGGMALLVLIRRLGLRTALNGPPWLLPDPLLSEMVARTPLPPAPRTRQQLESARQQLRSLAALARAALGSRRIPRSVRLAWP